MPIQYAGADSQVDTAWAMRSRCQQLDYHVGQQIRKRRQDTRVSQVLLASRIGVSFQQIQKYERGKNRVSASMLYVIAGALQVSIEYFFQGFDQ